MDLYRLMCTLHTYHMCADVNVNITSTSTLYLTVPSLIVQLKKIKALETISFYYQLATNAFV